MSDEKRPRPVSELKLEVNEQANCGQTARDDAVYSIHYVGVDDDRDTTTVFYTYYTGGLRVFDVQDPTRPKEVAYYHPPPKEDTVLKPISPFFGDLQTPTWDSVTSDVRYRPETGEIWFVSIANGFQVVEGTGAAGALAPCPVRPRASVARDSLRASRRGLRLSGRAVAFRCVAGRRVAATVVRVEVSVARRDDGRCEFLSRPATLGAPRSCARPRYVRARLGPRRDGKVPWTFVSRSELPRGRYVARVRARDASGNVSRPSGRHAVKRFFVR
jgi:hypothetical protein